MALTRTDVANRVAESAGLTQAQAGDALRALESVVTEALVTGEAVKLTGFVSFDTGERAARTGRNPQTGEALEIPASTVVKISAGAALKNAVKK
ncbi:HU family DNA-binding protein [Demequina sediminicola]|uniref:HU family DNA-binding protein n=1 Tax=Demequina sediminicola TaxID=1095026 RepID=UPI000785D6ED|nr:HU family DNA-binding protein [Demequina sediminicola]